MNKESENIDQAGLVAAVDQAADAVVITDTSGRIRYAVSYTHLDVYKRQHRNRAEPILNPTLSEVPFSSTVVKSLLPLQVTDIRDQFR